MNRFVSALRGSVAALALAGMVLQGCAAPAGYAIATDDPCGANRQELKAIEDYFVQSIVTGAAAGALGGALMGGLIGGDAKGALIGAAAGAAVGALGGYFNAKANASGTNRTQLVSTVYGDVLQENQQIDRTTATFRRLSQCRFAAAAAIKTRFQQGTISRDEAAKQLERQRVWFAEDAQFAENLSGKMQERGNEYNFASDKLIEGDPNARNTLTLRRQQQQQQQTQAALAAQGPLAIASAAANIRERPNQSARRVGGLAKGEKVSIVGGQSGWSEVRTVSGLSGYVANSTLTDESGRPLGPTPRPQTAARPAPAPAARPAATAEAPPPNDVAGVAQLTESNQLKRKAFGDQIAETKVAANSAFDLDAKISGAPAGAIAG
jgi:hypothetical protein